MSGFQCPFCGMIMSENGSTLSEGHLAFNALGSTVALNPQHYGQILIIKMHKCPHCGEEQISAYGIKGKIKDTHIEIYPNVIFKHFPDYIPQVIRSDYEEACAIVELSPKASATLSRRCLQGMIRDFWNIKKGNLAGEINELQGKIPTAQWKVIDGLRRLGNIGAHMEKDIDLIVEIDPEEAHKLIKVIELLMKDWYINRHDQEELYSDVLGIDDEKQGLRGAK
jgi:sarcosine oxidase delta subunit